MLWELLQLTAFKIPAHFGHGLMYYKCRQKACSGLLSAGLVPVPSTCRGLWITILSVSLSPNKWAFVIIHSRLLWSSFVHQHRTDQIISHSIFKSSPRGNWGASRMAYHVKVSVAEHGQPECKPQNPYGGRRESAPESCKTQCVQAHTWAHTKQSK